MSTGTAPSTRSKVQLLYSSLRSRMSFGFRKGVTKSFKKVYSRIKTCWRPPTNISKGSVDANNHIALQITAEGEARASDVGNTSQRPLLHSGGSNASGITSSGSVTEELDLPDTLGGWLPLQGEESNSPEVVTDQELEVSNSSRLRLRAVGSNRLGTTNREPEAEVKTLSEEDTKRRDASLARQLSLGIALFAASVAITIPVAVLLIWTKHTEVPHTGPGKVMVISGGISLLTSEAACILICILGSIKPDHLYGAYLIILYWVSISISAIFIKVAVFYCIVSLFLLPSSSAPTPM